MRSRLLHAAPCLLLGLAVTAHAAHKETPQSTAKGHGNGSHPEKPIVPREPSPSEGHGDTHDRRQSGRSQPAANHGEEGETNQPSTHGSEPKAGVRESHGHEEEATSMATESPEQSKPKKKSWFDDGLIWFGAVFVILMLLIFTLG